MTEKYARNAREIARVLGIVLKRQSNRLKAQLAEITEWTRSEDWPQKVKAKGWPASGIRDWVDRHGPEIAAMKQKQAALADILGNDVPKSKSFKLVTQQSSEPSETDAGLPWAGGKIPSQAAMANELVRRYKLPCSRQNHIQAWTSGNKLPNPLAPRFPPPDSGNGYSPDQVVRCFEWYEQWVVNPLKAAQAANDAQGDLFAKKSAEAQMADLEKTIDEARIKRLDADNRERELSEKWILRDVARATAIQAVNDLLHVIMTEYERNAPVRRREKLQTLGIAPEALTTFYDWDAQDEQARIDRIKLLCASRAV